MTADPDARLSSMDVLDAEECVRLDELGNRAVLTQPAAPVSIPALFAEQVSRAPMRWRCAVVIVGGPTASSMRRRIGWRTC